MSHSEPRSISLKGSDLLGDLVLDNPSYLSNWMKDLDDDTPLENINIPGTHDAAAWNYHGLNYWWYNCQDKPLLEQLDGGIRLLDLRFGYSLLHEHLYFYHGSALLSDNTTLQDVLAGFQQWLAVHPTETLLLSLKVDNGPTDAALEETLYNLITSDEGKTFWSQLSGELGTLGQVRGKAVFLRRFPWTELPANITTPLPGIDVSPTYWADNDPSFIINHAPGHAAHIEDYYNIQGEVGIEVKVDAKINATTTNISSAVANFNSPDDAGAFWISFASAAGYIDDVETIWPKTLAEGDDDSVGVNRKLYTYLQQLGSTTKGAAGQKRLGAILLDFFASVDDLVPQIIRLNF